MNSPNDRFIFEPAQPQDGPELLAILEDSPFKGGVSLLFTRRPDPMTSFGQEGSGVEVLVCRDRDTHRIAGFGAYAIRELFLNGREQKAGYIFSLRSHKNYLKTYPILNKAYDYLRGRLDRMAPVISFTTILQENNSARRLLEKTRRTMPVYRPLGAYEVYAVKSLNRGPDSARQNLQTAVQTDIPDLTAFLREQGARFQFFPNLTAENFIHGLPGGLRLDNFYILRDSDGQIIAAGALWDQRAYRQYFVQGYRGLYRLARPVSAICNHPCLPSFPAPGSLMDFRTLSFWAVKNNDPALMDHFLESLRRRPEAGPLLMVGIHEGNRVRTVLQKKTLVVYRSLSYWVDWNKTSVPAEPLDPARPIYFECGTL